MGKLVAIGDVAEVNPTVPKGVRLAPDATVAFVPMASVTEDGRFTALQSRPAREVLKGYTYFERGDVILAKITPCMENGKAAHLTELPQEVGFGSTEFHVLRPGPRVDGRYLFYAVWNAKFRQAAAENMTGTGGQQRVPAAYLARQEIPLPPLPEQHRIAAILDKADAVRRKRREVVKLADAFLKSAFLEMFGDPVGNPRGWPVVDLERTFADSPQLGTLVPVEESGTIPVVRVGQLGQPAPDWSSCGQVSLDRKEVARYLLRPNDLLMARAIGSLDHLGKASIVCADDPPAVFDSHVMRLRFDQNVLASGYFHTLLLTPGGRARFLVQASRTAVQFNISGGKIARMRVPLPPPELQADFVQLRERTLAMGASLREAEVTADQLFHSLVARAFSGEL